MSKKIIMLKGLPASGKSSYAKELIRKQPNSYKRINNDLLREMMDDSHWSGDNEDFVKKVRAQIIVAALEKGKHVIIDNTNLSPKVEASLKQLVKEFNKANNDSVVLEIKTFFDISVEECIKRDLTRTHSVGEKVIRQMYDEFLAPKCVPVKQDESLPKAILVDIDGTVAEKLDRSPFDWKRVGNDAPKVPIINVVKALKLADYKIIFFSGRDGVCFPETKDWICRHFGWTEDEFLLYMRNEKDGRKDSIVKKEMFDNYIRDKFYVECIIDDRQQVVDMYRKELGLTVMQVDYGNF